MTPRAAGILQAVAALPPLPAVAVRVMQVAQDPRSSASDLALVVSADPGLTATFLRVVNSAAYRRSRTVTSVQDALVVLGFNQARNIAVSGAIAGRYPANPLDVLFRIDAFWRHTIAVAFRASALAARTKRLDVPTAFTAGIVHNIGRLAMFFADAPALDEAVAEALALEVPLETVELAHLGYEHAEVGAILARRWKLPAEIIEAVRDHHRPGLPETSIAGAVAAADRFCVANNVLPGYIRPTASPSNEPASADFARLMRQADDLVELISRTVAPINVREA
jgi:putative nucleotidyltransferase with HDIG domain